MNRAVRIRLFGALIALAVGVTALVIAILLVRSVLG
jgi:heme exporter protein D